MPQKKTAWGGRNGRPRRSRLEGIFDTHLDDAVSVVVVCVPKRPTAWSWAGVAGVRRVAQRAVREVELEVVVAAGERRQGMVHEVERGEAELQVLMLRDGEPLDERNVAVPEHRSGNVRSEEHTSELQSLRHL